MECETCGRVKSEELFPAYGTTCMECAVDLIDGRTPRYTRAKISENVKVKENELVEKESDIREKARAVLRYAAMRRYRDTHIRKNKASIIENQRKYYQTNKVRLNLQKKGMRRMRAEGFMAPAKVDKRVRRKN